MHLLHTASIGHTGLAHIWVTNVVVGPISPTILVFGANVRGWWVRKIVVDCAVLSMSGISHTQAKEDARISTSLVSNSATLSFRIPSACSERK